MDINVAEHAGYPNATEVKTPGKAIKHLIKRLSKAFSLVDMDADAIFKSKDWPYLWRR